MHKKKVLETVEVKAQILDHLVIEINKSVDLLKAKIIDNLIKQNKLLSKKVSILEVENEHLYDRVYDIETGLYELQE